MFCRNCDTRRMLCVLIPAVLIALSACGGGTNNSSAPEASAANPDIGIVPDTSVQVVEEIPAASPAVKWQNQIDNGYHLTKKTFYSSTGTVNRSRVHEHDFSNDTSAVTIHWPSGSISGPLISYYSDDGNLSYAEDYYSDGRLASTTEYEFYGNQIIGITGDYHTDEFIYADSGAVLSRVTKAGSTIADEAEYKLDEHGRPMEKVGKYHYTGVNSTGLHTDVTTSFFEYNEDGQIILITSFVAVSSKTTKLRYDGVGNLVEAVHYLESGDYAAKEVYEYDKSPKPRVNLKLLSLRMWL